MKLFRVYWDSAVPSFLVAKNGFPLGSEMLYESGNHLLTISMIRDFASSELRFGDGPETIAAPARRAMSEPSLALLKLWD